VNLDQNPYPSEAQRQAQNTIVIGTITALTIGVAAIYALLSNSVSQLWSILPILLVSLLAIWLSRIGKHMIGSILLISVVALQGIIAPLIESGLGISSAIG